MRTYEIVLSGSGESRRSIKGRYLRILSATGTIVTRMDQGASFDLAQGIGLEWSRGFSELVFNGSAQTIQIAVSDERIDDSRLSVTAPVQLKVPGSLVDGTYAQLVNNTLELAIAANPNRRRVVVRASANNTQAIKVGGSGMGAGGSNPGIGLGPNETQDFYTTDAIYVLSSLAGTRISYFEEEYA